MESVKLAIIIALVAAAGVALRLLLYRDDRDRIRRHIESQEGRLLSVQHDPLETNTFGRLYEVCFIGADEKKHRTQYRTQLFSLEQVGGDVIEEDVECPFNETSGNRSLEES